MTKKVAIILTTYNGGQWLEEQLRSIAAQQGVRWRLFVRDDGSTDDTATVLSAFMETHAGVERIEPTEGPTGSPAGNFFLALRHVNLADFDYVAFADQDDVWAPAKLSRAVDCLEQTGAGGYSSDLIAFDNDRQLAWYLKKSGEQRHIDYLFQGASAGCTYVLTQAAVQLVLERTGSLPTTEFLRHSHDWLIYAICRSHGVAWHMDRTANIFYRQHRGNAFGAMPNASGLKARLQLAKSGWYREHVLWLQQFLEGTPQETEVLKAIAGNGFRDRLWLAANVSGFRRTPRDRFLLAFTLLCGWF